MLVARDDVAHAERVREDCLAAMAAARAECAAHPHSQVEGSGAGAMGAPQPLSYLPAFMVVSTARKELAKLKFRRRLGRDAASAEAFAHLYQ